MKTLIDSHTISAQVADILWFYGIPTTQSVDRSTPKTRYWVEVTRPTDFAKAAELFPLRKWT
jgi:hypothetical protein